MPGVNCGTIRLIQLFEELREIANRENRDRSCGSNRVAKVEPTRDGFTSSFGSSPTSPNAAVQPRGPRRHDNQPGEHERSGPRRLQPLSWTSNVSKG